MVNGEIFYPGDAITGWVLAVIDDSLKIGSTMVPLQMPKITTASRTQLPVITMPRFLFQQKNPVLTGLDDPNLFAEIQANCNLSAEMYVGSPEDILSEVVLAYVNDNNDFNAVITVKCCG